MATRADHGDEGSLRAARERLGPGVDDWLAGLSQLVAELTARWELRLGEPLAGRSIGYSVAAVRGETEPVVLELTYPDGWFPEEVAALAHWDGAGVVELVDHDPRGALLLERPIPGTPLTERADEEGTLGILSGILERLWAAPVPGEVTRVATETTRWADAMAERNEAIGGPVPADLVDEATELLRELASGQHEELLLHGDLRAGAVRAAEREPWLAVDPSPLVGERAFDVSAVLRDRASELVRASDASEQAQWLLDRLAERLACDRERLRAWSIAIATGEALGAFEDGADGRAGGDVQLRIARLFRHLRS